MLLDDVRTAWLPPDIPKAVDWIPAHVRMPSGSETEGLFDFGIAPHTRGVLEAWDDPTVREIHLCWATRNMKTTTFIALMIFAAANTPRPMAYGSVDEKTVDLEIDDKIYPMLEACDVTRPQLLPAAKRGRDSIKLTRCRIRKAFSGSKASVAGYPACYVFMNEVDKWTRKKSSEADAVRGFRQRTKGYPYDSKVCCESTPGDVDTSRMWSIVRSAQTDVRRYHVPCPHCGEFQTLVFGQIKWEKTDEGNSDSLLAEKTAWYECLHCRKKIDNEDRPQMMRGGRWVSDGQQIDRQGRISGKKKVESPRVAFAYLGTEYSLLVPGWGWQAAEFLQCGNDPEKLRDFRNSNQALPWDPKPVKMEPHELGERLCTDDSKDVCPDWSIFLTRGVDVQEGGNVFKWKVSAWGPGGRGATVAWGVCSSESELEIRLSQDIFPHADGGKPLKPVLTLIDSGDGNCTEEVYDLCRRMSLRGIRCMPCKGSSKSTFPEAFKLSNLEEDEKPGSKRRKVYAGGIVLVVVNTERSQSWLQKQLDGTITADQPTFYSLPDDARLDIPFLDELLNEFKKDGKWTKRGPNDFRDATRYAWAAAMFVTNQGQLWNQLPQRTRAGEIQTAPERRDSKRNIFTEGGGREWRNG